MDANRLVLESNGAKRKVDGRAVDRGWLGHFLISKMTTMTLDTVRDFEQAVVISCRKLVLWQITITVLDCCFGVVLLLGTVSSSVMVEEPGQIRPLSELFPSFFSCAPASFQTKHRLPVL